MVDACELPQTQVTVWTCRSRIQVIRSGLIDNAFEAESWMHAPVTHTRRRRM